MKKFLARVLAAAMVLGMLTVSALAYDLPDNSLLQASSASTGTAAVTDWEGESHTVYRYPAGTVFSVKTGMTNFAMVTDLSTGDTVPMVPQQQFTLPETGAYRLTAYDQGIWTTTAYVMAEGAPIPEPQPKPDPEPEPEPEPEWYETGTIYEVEPFYVEYLGSNMPSSGTRDVTINGDTVAVSIYPAGTLFQPFYPLSFGEILCYENGELISRYFDPRSDGLPADGVYRIGVYSAYYGHEGDIWVTAEGSGTSVEPEPEEPGTVAGFTDVSSDAWYAGFVETVAEKGLFAGNGDGTFAPENNMTYAEFLAVLFQFSGDTLPAVTGDNWYDSYVEWAQPILPAGIADGFDAEAAITRQDMAALFGTFLSLYDYEAEPVNSGSPSFSDEGSIADYAKGGVALCYQLGIMNGNDDGTFAPGSNAIRAEVAVTMVQMARVMGR